MKAEGMKEEQLADAPVAEKNVTKQNGAGTVVAETARSRWNSDISLNALVNQMEKHRLYLVGFVLLLLLNGAVILSFTDPMTSSWYPKCPIHYLTGINCPGCGSSRSVHALVHGDLWMSFRYNPLFWPYVLFTLALAFYPRMALNRKIAVSVAAITIVYGVIRNIPWGPFLWLIPPVPPA